MSDTPSETTSFNSTPANIAIRTLLRFFLAAICIAAVVIAVGWFTDIRGVMHNLFLTLAVAAFLPFVLIVGGLLLAMAAFLLMALLTIIGAEVGLFAGDSVMSGAQLSYGGTKLMVPYYKFLARQRHPLFWGTIVGFVFGVAILWAIIALVVVPGESQTLQVFANAQEQIEQAYAETGKFPAATPEGHLLLQEGIRPDDPKAVEFLVRDGFGRPIEYETSGKWKFQTYRLKSLGFDRKPGRDDLCLSGATKGAALLGKALDAWNNLRQLFGADKDKVRDRLAAIQLLRCKEE